MSQSNDGGLLLAKLILSHLQQTTDDSNNNNDNNTQWLACQLNPAPLNYLIAVCYSLIILPGCQADNNGRLSPAVRASPMADLSGRRQLR